MTEVLGRWWNGKWGNWTRRWVWLEKLDDSQLQVRWRGGDWDDRDGSLRTRNPDVAIEALRRLMEADAVGEWREIPLSLYRRG